MHHTLDFCPRPAKMGRQENLRSYFPNIYILCYSTVLTSASWLRGCCCSSKWRLLKSKVGAFVEFYTFLSLACLLLRTVWLSLIKEEDTMFRKCSICFLFFYCLPGGCIGTKMKNCWCPSLFCSMGVVLGLEWKVIIRNSVFFIK